MLLRKELDLYACIRPCKAYEGVRTRFPETDIVIVRENTEDLYAGIEFEQDTEDDAKLREFLATSSTSPIREHSGISIKPISVFGSERIVEAAFDYAERERPPKVTAAHKANIMKFSDGLFLEVARKVAERHPDIEFEDRIIDNLCNQLVSRPEEYDVIVLPNLYGDIVSDLGAGMIGGLGLAPGGNIGTEAAMFEATHGSAPKYKGQNKVNPTALMLSGVLMLRHLDEREAADRLEGAIAEVIRKGEKVTYDLKPTRDDPTAVGTSRVRRRRDRGDEPVSTHPSTSPSPAPPGRSATRSCSGSPAASCSAPTRRSQLQPARDPARGEGRRGHGDGARRLRLPAAGAGSTSSTIPTRPSTARTSRCSWAPGRARKGMERADLLEANGGIFRPQGEAINDHAADDIKRAGGRQPGQHERLIAMSNAPDVPARALHRDDAARPQPRDRPAREEAGAAVTDITNMTIWGNHSTDPVPRPLPREGQRSERRRGGRRPGVDRRTSSSPRWQARRGDHRGARRVQRRLGGQRRDRPRARLGSTAPPTATGSRWRCPPTAPTASRRGLISAFPVTTTAASTDRRGPRDRRLLTRRASTRPSLSCAEERDAVKELGC